MPQRPHPMTGGEQRDLIEEVGAQLFAENGYAQTRIEDIAWAAGVTKPVLYRHFVSKRALHMTLLCAHRDALLAAMLEAATTSGPLRERLPVVLDAWFGYVEANPYAWRMLFRDTTDEPEVQAFHVELHAGAREAICDLVRSEPEVTVPPAQLQPLSELIRSSCTGLALWWLANPEFSRENIVELETDVIAGMLEAQEPVHPV